MVIITTKGIACCDEWWWLQIETCKGQLTDSAAAATTKSRMIHYKRARITCLHLISLNGAIIHLEAKCDALWSLCVQVGRQAGRQSTGLDRHFKSAAQGQSYAKVAPVSIIRSSSNSSSSSTRQMGCLRGNVCNDAVCPVML